MSEGRGSGAGPRAIRRRAARVRVERMRGGRFSARGDNVAVEEPMEVRLEVPGAEGTREHPVSVTMRTPGHDFELAAGFLFTEGVVVDPRAVADVRYCRDVEPQEYNVVTASVRDPSAFDAASLTRNFYVTSSCGVCGKASLESVEVMGCQPVADGTFAVAESDIRALPDRLRSRQRIFERTGGIHAAGLFDRAGRMTVVREDVGRHNAVDKVVGTLVLSRSLPGSELGLAVSGRSSFEILQKAAMAGIPAVVAVGAPSSLAVAFARRFNMTLVGFANRDGYNVYSGGDRIVRREAAAG